MHYFIYTKYIYKVNIFMKKCSTSLAIRETQVITTMRYHFTLVRMATINNSTNSSHKRDTSYNHNEIPLHTGKNGHH